MSVFLMSCFTNIVGAVVPSKQDALFESWNSFTANLESVAPALGLTRVKRGSDGKLFTFNGAGVSADFSDDDEDILFKRTLRISLNESVLDKLLLEWNEYFQLTKVNLLIEFSAEKFVRNAFISLIVKYEIESSWHTETGILTVYRDFNGKQWITAMDIEHLTNTNSPNNNVIPSFSITLLSDHKTFLGGKLHFQSGHFLERRHSMNMDYNMNIQYTSYFKKIEATFSLDASSYIFSGDFDKNSKKVLLKADLQGSKYGLELNFDGTKDNHFQFMGVFSPDLNTPAINYVLNFHADKYKYLTDAALDVLYSSEVLFHLGLRGFTRDGFKYELRYKSPDKPIGDGSIRLSYEPEKLTNKKVVSNSLIKFQFLPRIPNLSDLEFTTLIALKRLPRGERITVNVTDYEGELLLENTNEYTHNYNEKVDNDDDEHDDNKDREIEISLNFKFKHFLRGMRGYCQNTVTVKAITNKRIPNRFKLHLEDIHDGERALLLKINTMGSPYKIHVYQPFLIPEIYRVVGFPRQDTFKLKAVQGPGDVDWKISSSIEDLSLTISEIDGTNQNDADNTTQITVNLPSGQNLTGKLNWQYTQNEKFIKAGITGIETHNFDVYWNHQEDTYKVVANGVNNWLGKYDFKREAQVYILDSHMKGKWTGISNFESAPWPSPVETEADFDIYYDGITALPSIPSISSWYFPSHSPLYPPVYIPPPPLQGHYHPPPPEYYPPPPPPPSAGNGQDDSGSNDVFKTALILRPVDKTADEPRNFTVNISKKAPGIKFSFRLENGKCIIDF